MVSADTRLSPPIHCPHQQPSRLPVENSLRAIQINYNPRFDNPVLIGAAVIGKNNGHPCAFFIEPQ